MMEISKQINLLGNTGFSKHAGITVDSVAKQAEELEKVVSRAMSLIAPSNIETRKWHEQAADALWGIDEQYTAIQRLQDENKQLKEEVQPLKEQINDLEDKFAASERTSMTLREAVIYAENRIEKLKDENKRLKDLLGKELITAVLNQQHIISSKEVDDE